MTPILPENTVDFPRYCFGDKKKSCLENSIPRHSSCLCDLFIFCRMIPVIAKLFDITYLFNTYFAK